MVKRTRQNSRCSNHRATSPLARGLSVARLAPEEFRRVVAANWVLFLNRLPGPLANTGRKEAQRPAHRDGIVLQQILSLFGAEDETQPRLKNTSDRWKFSQKLFFNFRRTHFTRGSRFERIARAEEYVSYSIQNRSADALRNPPRTRYVNAMFDRARRITFREVDFMGHRKLDASTIPKKHARKEKFPGVSWGVLEDRHDGSDSRAV